MIIGIFLIIIVLLLIFIIINKANKEIRKSKESVRDLDSFGYTQELFRDMGGFTNFAVSFSIISILTGAVTLYGFGFNQGGPAVMGYGWPLVTIFILLISSSMAELTSAIPTSGALYHWSAILGNKTCGWFTAWFNLLGNIAALVGINYGCATFAASLLFKQPTRPQFLVIYLLIFLSQGLINHYGLKLVSILNNISAVYHLICVTLLVGSLYFFCRHRDFSYLFDTSFSTAINSGNPYWFAFLIGLLQAQWTYTGYDASAHISEETLNSNIRAPWGVFMSVAISAIFGFIMIAIVTLSITNPEAVAAAGANGFIIAIQQGLGINYGAAIMWTVTIAMWFCGLSAIISVSRMIYAFSRDNGLPFSKKLGKISVKYKVPATGIWISIIIGIICGLAENIYAIVTAISVISLYISYGIPIFLKFIAQIRGIWRYSDNGPWSLGNWSKIISFLSILWIIFIIILFSAGPSDVKITDNYTLNYATGKIFFAVTIALIFYYYIFVRKYFKGPNLGLYTLLNMRLRNKIKK